VKKPIGKSGCEQRLVNPLTGNSGWTRAANWQLSGKLGPGGYTRAWQTTVNWQRGFTRGCQSI